MALQKDQPGAQFPYIILSGEFGSPPYLYEEMNERCQMNAGLSSCNSANARIMKVIELRVPAHASQIMLNFRTDIAVVSSL